MPKKIKAHKGKKESPSMNKGAHNKGQGRGANKTGENWQQGRNEGSGNANEYWKQGSKNGSGNANGNPNLFPGMDNLTQGGCLPTFWARIKNAFSRSARGGCLPKLFILTLPMLAVGAILFITL